MSATKILPPALRLGTVRLAVDNRARSLDFYHSLLGFGGHPELLELEEQPGVKPVGLHPRFGIYHFAILLPHRAQLGALIAHLDRHQVRYGSADHGVSEALYLQDPDGITVEIYADRPGIIPSAIKTDPLDFSSLRAAAEGESWNGLPARSSVGHIHFYVGDLKTAAAFYQHTLGFQRTVHLPSALFLSAGGYHHHLGLNTWAAPSVPAGPQDARLLEWQILLPSFADVNTLQARLERSGIDIQHGENGELSIRDPWNTLLTISTK